MTKYHLLLFLLFTAAGCSRKDCVNGEPVLSFQNFDPADLALIEITAYERGSSFRKTDKVFYAGSSVKNFGEDSVGIPIPIDLTHDYELRFVNSGLMYQVHELFFLEKNFKEGLGGKSKACINELAYTINTKKLRRAMKMINEGNPLTTYIFIDKQESY